MPEIKLNAKFAPLWLSEDMMAGQEIDDATRAQLDKYKDVDYFILNSGRGPGKSFVMAQWGHDSLQRCPYQRIAYTRVTMSSTDDSIIEEFREKVSLFGTEDEFDIVSDKATHKNGNFVRFMGLLTASKKQSAKQKSLKDFNTWILEEAEELDDEDLFDKIDNSIRVAGHRCRIILAFNAQHKKHFLFKRFYEGKMPDGSDVPYDYNGVIGNVCYIWTYWPENAENLSPKFIRKAQHTKRTNLLRYNWIYRGEWQDDLEGALWNQELIAQAKSLNIKMSDLVRVCIALDPTVSDEEDIDDCGIIGVGKTADDRYLVFSDRTGIYTPKQWGDKAIIAYNQFEANAIVAEVNQGGALVEGNIRSCAQALGLSPQAIKVVKVHASKGKLVRAEPVATLYEFGKVAHSPGLSKLEAEMCTYTGKKGEPSPGRLDALVWGITWLSGNVYATPKVRSLG